MNWGAFWAVIPGILIFMIPITAIIVGYLNRKLQSEERLRAIEKGVPIPQTTAEIEGRHSWDRPSDPWERAAGFRVGGLICMAVGVGIGLLFAGLAWSLPEFPEGLIAVAAIPFLVGAVLFYEFQVRTRELGPRPMPPASTPQPPM
jgi:hypothetical protein